MAPQAIFIHSSDLVQFTDDIRAYLNKGWDLYGGLTIGNGEAGQWLVESRPFHEFHLLIATSADVLNALAQKYIGEGWDFYMSTVVFEDQYLQWMCRENDYHTLFGKKLHEALDGDIPFHSSREKFPSVAERAPFGGLVS